jgi:hypothetical protein
MKITLKANKIISVNNEEYNGKPIKIKLRDIITVNNRLTNNTETHTLFKGDGTLQMYKDLLVNGEYCNFTVTWHNRSTSVIQWDNGQALGEAIIIDHKNSVVDNQFYTKDKQDLLCFNKIHKEDSQDTLRDLRVDIINMSHEERMITALKIEHGKFLPDVHKLIKQQAQRAHQLWEDVKNNLQLS